MRTLLIGLLNFEYLLKIIKNKTIKALNIMPENYPFLEQPGANLLYLHQNLKMSSELSFQKYISI